ncbi:hypothetical protein KKB18_07290, partial [bacterium]|nr:hypothetical protein [bacterium]
SFWKYYQLSKRDHIIESENKESHQKGRRIFLFCYILSTIANIYTMHSGLLVFILINLFYVTFSRKYIGEWLFSNLIILMSYVPQLPVTLIQILGYRGGFKFESFHPLFLISNIVSFFSGYIFLPLQITQISSFKGNTKIQLFFMITSLYCIISVVKAVIELKKERDKLCYLALIFFPLLFFFMKMGVTPNHMVLIMPILISTTIFGLSRFSKLIFFSAFGILIICNLFAMKDYYKLMVYPFQPMDWREFAKIIEENEQPGDIVYLGGNRNILFTFRYYYKGNLPSRIYLDENDIYKLPTDYRRSDYDLKGGFLKTVESANRIWLITLRDDLILIPIIQAWMSNPSQAVFSDYVLSVNMNFNPAENSPSFKNYIEVYGQNKGYDFIPPMQIYLIEKKLI